MSPSNEEGWWALPIGGPAAALVTASDYCGAQVAGNVPRIGGLSYLSRGNPPRTLALLDGLRELDYVEGGNLVVDCQADRVIE